jgi:hypothetical protein
MRVPGSDARPGLVLCCAVTNRAGFAETDATYYMKLPLQGNRVSHHLRSLVTSGQGKVTQFVLSFHHHYQSRRSTMASLTAKVSADCMYHRSIPGFLLYDERL